MKSSPSVAGSIGLLVLASLPISWGPEPDGMASTMVTRDEPNPPGRTAVPSLLTRWGRVVTVHEDFSVSVSLEDGPVRVDLAGIEPDPEFQGENAGEICTVLSQMREYLAPGRLVKLQLIAGSSSQNRSSAFMTTGHGPRFVKPIDYNEYLLYLGHATLIESTALSPERLDVYARTQEYAKSNRNGLWAVAGQGVK